MKMVGIFMCLYVLVGSTHGLSCPCYELTDYTCGAEPTEDDCPFGLVPDVCACCSECAKGPGEECGGYWGIRGTCGRGYTCVEVPGIVARPYDFDGICQ